MLHLPIFVYGTLKRGQRRENRWPRRPLRVEEGTVVGQLHDLGEYPALVEGRLIVAGELWHFAADDLSITLETLDAIEGHTGVALDLYTRRNVDCTTVAGIFRVYTYFFAHPGQIADRPLVSPDVDGRCWWRGTYR